MLSGKKIEQLKEMLGSKLIRNRKAGIEMAREMLAQDSFRNHVRKLLEELARDDLILGVKKLAQNTLAEDDARHSPKPAPPPDYVFGAKCEHCHRVTYLDKRIVCAKHSNFLRRTASRGEKNVDEILVTCENCGKQFYTLVPCEGYK